MIAVVVGVVALLSATGRAVLPIVAGLAAFMVAAKYLAIGLGNNNAGESGPWGVRTLGSPDPGESGPWGHFGVSEVVVLAAAPLVVFIVTRAITAGANSRFPTRRVPLRAGDDL